MLTVNVVALVLGEPETLVRFAVRIQRGSTFWRLAAAVEQHLVCTHRIFEPIAPRVAGLFTPEPGAAGPFSLDHAVIRASIQRRNVLQSLEQFCETHSNAIALVIPTWGGYPGYEQCHAFHSSAPGTATQLVQFLDEGDENVAVLSLSTSVFPASKMYVRDAYKQLAGYLWTNMRAQTKAFVITGTPGIGKTMFLWYLLRFLRKQPVVVIFDCAGLFLLVEPSGVILSGVRGVSFDLQLSHPDTIYLCDAMPQHEPLFGACIRATTIVTKSPDQSLLKQFVKSERPKVLYMPVWSLEELEDCRGLCYGSTTSRATVAALYDHFGGTARDTLVPDQDLAITLKRFHTAVESLTDADMKINFHFIGKSDVEDTKENKICHPLVHLQPMKDDAGADQFDQVSLLPASRLACREIVRGMATVSAITVRQLLSSTARIPQLAASRGHLFEGWAHNTLTTGGTFRIRELGVGSQPDGAIGHKTIAAQSVVFGTIATVQGGQYGIPTAQNYPVIDATIAPNELFQMTVSAAHPIHHENLKSILHQLITKAKPVGHFNDENKITYADLKAMEFKLYFVVPDDQFDTFKAQPFTRADGRPPFSARTVPIQQYALCIDLRAMLPTDHE